MSRAFWGHECFGRHGSTWLTDSTVAKLQSTLAASQLTSIAGVGFPPERIQVCRPDCGASLRSKA